MPKANALRFRSSNWTRSAVHYCKDKTKRHSESSHIVRHDRTPSRVSHIVRPYQHRGIDAIQRCGTQIFWWCSVVSLSLLPDFIRVNELEYILYCTDRMIPLSTVCIVEWVRFDSDLAILATNEMNLSTLLLLYSVLYCWSNKRLSRVESSRVESSRVELS